MLPSKYQTLMINRFCFQNGNDQQPFSEWELLFHKLRSEYIICSSAGVRVGALINLVLIHLQEQIDYRSTVQLNIQYMEGDKTGTGQVSPTKKKSMTTEDFTIKHRLGKGAYGDVFLVIKNSDHKSYALKQIQKKKLEREQKEYQAMVQKELLSNMKHPGIVKLRYSFQDKQSLYFVLQFCQGGDFINFIRNNITKLTEEAKIFYIAEIVNILEYIHKSGVTHRDLKPENLMLDKRGHLKLIDFGTAQITNSTILKPEFKQHIIKLKKKSDETVPVKQASEDEPSEYIESESPLKKRRSTFVGTCYYISPELLEHNYCPPSADLWALGCIIYQMYYLETPFKDTYEFAVFEKIKKAEITFPKNETITEEAIDLIKQLLIKDPDARLGSCTTQELSYKKLKGHPFFKGIDVDNIFSRPVPHIPDLQAIGRTELQKMQASQTLQSFKGQIQSLIKGIAESGKEIIKYQIVEEKTFIVYSYVLLVLCKEKEVILVSSDEIDKKRQLVLKNGQKVHCTLGNANHFLIQEQERVTEILCSNAEEWVAAINSDL